MNLASYESSHGVKIGLSYIFLRTISISAVKSFGVWFYAKTSKNFVQEVAENFVQGMDTPCTKFLTMPCTKFFELIGVHLAQFVPNDVLIL
jgi:hypothetical protein